jgi:alpha-beta hydrolase superfamily lysophospholipase
LIVDNIHTENQRGGKEREERETNGMESSKMRNTNNNDQNEQSLDDLLVYEELAFTIPSTSKTNNTITSGEDEDEKESNSNNNNNNNNNDDDDDNEPLITAVARAPFYFNDADDDGGGGCLLNVELFGFASSDDDNDNNIISKSSSSKSSSSSTSTSNCCKGILCFVHGVCESAETWTVQNLARICQKQKWKLAVLELEGHGLSHGRHRGLLNVGKMNRYVQQVVQFYKHIIKIDRIIQQEQKKKKKNDDGTKNIVPTKFALCGCSLGGTLAAYASQQIMKEKEKEEDDEYENQHHHQFVGTILISPAVGIDPKVIPSSFILSTLSILSSIIPSIGFMTPIEDPLHYNCPSTTKRNYTGSWPLGTSKLLLDITSKIVPNDIQNGILNLNLNMILRNKKKNKQQYNNNSVVPTTTTTTTIRTMIISGDKDPVVPIEAVRNFVSTMMVTQNLNQEQEQQEKITTTATTSPTSNTSSDVELIEINKGDHGLLAQSVNHKHISKTKKK